LDRFGPIETGQICDAINTIPPITVRCNTLKTHRKKLKNFLEEYVEKIEYTAYAPDGVFFLSPKKSIPEIAAFKDGLFQVQDEAAQLVTLLLNPKPGETVLDACAGLGGKTGHIAQMMNGHGTIIAMDKNKKKLERLKSEMHRLGISIVTTRTHNLNEPFNREDYRNFDRILLDAPCSGLGVLRRNPDAKWRISELDLLNHQKRQSKFLGNLAALVKPGGVLVYTVCSTEPEENESVIKDFLNKHSEFAIVKSPDGLTSKVRSLITEDGYFKTSTHLHNMDGFFSIHMKRIK
jgi:16S rRNA (cytosine967-C5)-methyltransferase